MRLEITDGVNTVVLSGDGAVAGCTYFPRTPAGDGDPDVTETVEINFHGTQAQIRATTAAIDRMREIARLRRESGNGARVFLRYTPITAEAICRSEVLEARFEWSNEPGLRRLKDGETTAIRAAGALIIRRAPWWDAAVTSQAVLSSKAQPQAGTGGRYVHNRNDGTGGNYVDVPANTIRGTERTPARLVLQNNMASAQQHRTIFVAATGPMSSLDEWQHVIEGESALPGSGTVTNSSGNSNGQVLSLSFSGLTIPVWQLPASMVRALGGRTCRLFARFNWYPTGAPIYVKPGIEGLVLPGDEVRLPMPAARELVDLGSFTLPTSEYTNPAPLQLRLSFRTAQQALIELDYLLFMITREGFRQIEFLGGALNPGESIVDDAPEQSAYTQASDGQRPTVAVYGDPIWLYPSERPQRLCFVIDQGFQAPVNRTLNVSVHYRTRRVSV